MELVDGKPLNELIPRKGTRLTEALRIAAQVADALTAAHAAGIVHRDLKPANIMVDAHGRAKVLDFGLPKLAAPAARAAASADEATHTLAAGQPVSEEGVIVGSVPYMSPEQAEGKPVDARRHLLFRRGALRNGHRTAGVSRRVEDFHAGRHRGEGPAAGQRNLFHDAAGVGAPDRAVPAQGCQSAQPEHGGCEAGAGGIAGRIGIG
jgi:serine/threonine protein kinase